jgi:protoporphyrinogen oxidase
MPDRKTAIVVGAGPAGLTAASELLKNNYSVSILEQDPTYVGGISRTVEYKGFRFDIGGHRFFSKNKDIMNWWVDRLPHDFLRVKRKSRILYNGKFFDYPLRASNALRNLGLVISVRCLLSYFYARFVPIRPEVSFEDWVTNRFGRTLYTIFFKSYTEKVWGIPCSKISADWASQRIKGLSLLKAIKSALCGKKGDETVKTLIDSFYYPSLGPGMMWNRTRDDLERKGAVVMMGRKVIEISHRDQLVDSVTTVNTEGVKEIWKGSVFIFSMPLRETVLAMRPLLGEKTVRAAKLLTYRDFLTVALIIEGEKLFDDNWIYIHDPNVKVGRIQNFNNWSEAMVGVKGFTCLGFEYFVNVGDSVWSLSDMELKELAEAEGVKIGLIKRGAVRDACVVRMEKAYPVYNSDHQLAVHAIREQLNQIKNAEVVGRNGMHKYNNQDHSMMTGIIATRRLLGSDVDPWLVNTDAEYHEEETGGRRTPIAIAK